VGDPRAVEALARLALLVGAHRGDRALVGGGIRPRRDERRHPAHGERAAAVARGDEQVRVGGHERHGHLHVVAVGEDELGPLAEALDHREDVVPAARVEAVGVVAQLEEDLLHLERRGQRLDEHRGADGALGEPERVLAPDEDLVPQAGLEVVLELRQVEVRRRAPVEQPPGRVEREQPEVDEAAADGLVPDLQVLLLQVPAARAARAASRARRRARTGGPPSSRR
jgi:hypothetical protein